MDPGSDIGFWELSIIMVVIASWILYRYVAPKGWREWTRAGLVQAFIIALYAEMYGFPLTIYLLTGWLGINIPWAHDTGHLWEYLFGWGPLGAMVEMIVGYTFVFAGVSVLAEGWREVYVATKEGRLATDKLYGVLRHPQYMGIFLAIFGQLIHWPTIPTLVLFPVIVWAYYRLAKKEEEQMMQKFGAAYEAYRQRVPMFFPRQGEWKKLMSAGSSGKAKSSGSAHVSIRLSRPHTDHFVLVARLVDGLFILRQFISSIRSGAKYGFKSVEKTEKVMVQIMLSKLQVMDGSVFKKTALLAVGAVLLYYSVAWAVLRCPHLENPQAQEITAYEPGAAHRHANLDCMGPKYHTEFLAGPSTNSEVLRQAGVTASQENLLFGFADPALKQSQDFARLALFDGSSSRLPFGLPRYLSLSVLRF